MPVIDVHSHYLPRELPEYAARHGDDRWPALQIDDQGSRIVQHGQVYRVIDNSYYSLERRIEQMDKLGVAHQVLSPLPVSLVSWADPVLALDYCKTFNELLVAACRRHPGRFSAFGTVPLQDPDLAAAQLAGFRSVGLIGVEIGTWLGPSCRIDDPRMRTFFDAARDADLPILLHPNHEQTFTAGGPPGLEVAVGVGSDTARALCSLILADAFVDRDDLRLCAVHGGGTFFWLLPRLRRVVAPAKNSSHVPPGIYVDTAGLDGPNLMYLRTALGDDRIVFGTDMPAAAVDWTETTTRALHSLDWQADVIIDRNTVAFLGFDPTSPAEPSI